MKRNAIFSVFSEQSEVDTCVQHLREAGFRAAEISVLSSDFPGQKDFHQDQPTAILRGAAVGGFFGLLIGGAVGLLAGLEAFYVPFLSTTLFSHPLYGALLGGFFGALLGAGSGMLVGIGTPSTATDRYAHYLDDGGILVSVHCDNANCAQRAMTILESCGGSDPTMVNEVDAWKQVLSISHAARSPALI